ncbi:hypothetical protein ACB092_01G383700 [Castanea dentata]
MPGETPGDWTTLGSSIKGLGVDRAPEVANREDSWSLLRHLSSQLDLPWVCIGDFNEIARLGEKSGGPIRLESQMRSFRECLDFCALKDLGFSGLPYTWSNRRFDGSIVWVRLDRALASSDWFQKYPTARLHHLPGFSSDHKPIWLCTDNVSSRFYRQLRPFRFEAMWVTDERCEQVVHSTWDMGSEIDPMSSVLVKVSHCQEQLTTWNKKVFGNVRWKLAKVRKDLEKAEACLMAGEGSGRLATEDESQIGDILLRFYSNLFSSYNPSIFDPVLSGVDSRVTDDMNTELGRPFELSEIYEALHQMDLNTSPGPDVGDEVSEAVQSVLNSGNIPDNLNHTFLTLIPKIHSPRKGSNFRPISLSNVLYKIIAKGVFLSERIITDNILIAHENLHYLKQKRTGKLGYMVLKLDMSKAYDQVEWVFLEKIMLKMGFCQKWVDLVSACIRSPHGLITPSRLHALLRKAEVNGTIKGVSLCAAGPRVSHLLFADDKCVQIQSMLFISNTPRNLRNAIFVFLGLPSLVGRGKKRAFSLIKERIWKKLKGREILIKAVIQAIPTYAMSCFKLPKGLIKEIEILWKIHWNEGGLGFRDLSIFNDSLLEKQFFPSCSIMDCASLNKGSYAWKIWRIGDGQSVQIPRSISTPSLLPPTSTVSNLIDSGSNSWKTDLIRHEFLPHKANLILGIPLSDRSIPDKLAWLSSKNGSYNTRGAYRLVVGVTRSLQPSSSSQSNNYVLWSGIWKLQVPHRVKLFL